ncbi:hypothetical protein MLD38_037896 [Melastoma candidum]|uniref:Uncharacterized protein n=1 Tax=Melastoma candidum TaxID=119954 RepID=A0ACB9KXB4_9MYRT|nr:hypothetical protein MLD38_037896 [Melastoma candidum]
MPDGGGLKPVPYSLRALTGSLPTEFAEMNPPNSSDALAQPPVPGVKSSAGPPSFYYGAPTDQKSNPILSVAVQHVAVSSLPPGAPQLDQPRGQPSQFDSAPMVNGSQGSLNIASGPTSMTPPGQPQLYSTYPSLPPMGGNPQIPWLQPPPMTGLSRPTVLHYPAAFSVPFPVPLRGMPPVSMAAPNPQPPGTCVGISSVYSGNGSQSSSNLSVDTEVHPSVSDDGRHVHDLTTKNGNGIEQSDTWTSHKTENGIIYYYNSSTGESTYEKPSGFKGESNDTLKPSPISMEKVAGTDWEIITMNDGKKYYYNNKTKLSSWQIPVELCDMRKKQDVNFQKEDSLPVVTGDALAEKASPLLSQNTPAVITGGRDAVALRSSGTPGSSSSPSALDLIKRKLQESGTLGNFSPLQAASVAQASELNGSKTSEVTSKELQNEGGKEKLKDSNAAGNVSESSTDSEDADSEPTKEDRILQFKEMLKERGIVPFSKWEKELPKIVFDPRFKAIPSYSARRSLFEHYVKTRAEEERKEKRAAQKAAIEGFKQLLEEASEEIDHTTSYQSFRKKWGNDPRFAALDRKDRESLLNERVLPLKKVAEEKARVMRAAATSSFRSLIHDKGNVTVNSRWSKVKEFLRDDPRYQSVKHEEREGLFNEYIAELKASQEKEEREAKAKREEQEKLKERERELRKRKEREEQEVERVRIKIRRKEAVASFQALLVEIIKDPQASWTESKPKLEKDPQGRATHPELDSAETEKLFREHVKVLHERCCQEYRALLAEVITVEAAAEKTEDGKTVFNSWSTAKRLLKDDPRYKKIPRKDGESLWQRHVEEVRQKLESGDDEQDEKRGDPKSRKAVDSGRLAAGSRRDHDRRIAVGLVI